MSYPTWVKHIYKQVTQSDRKQQYEIYRQNMNKHPVRVPLYTKQIYTKNTNSLMKHVRSVCPCFGEISCCYLRSNTSTPSKSQGQSCRIMSLERKPCTIKLLLCLSGATQIADMVIRMLQFANHPGGGEAANVLRLIGNMMLLGCIFIIVCLMSFDEEFGTEPRNIFVFALFYIVYNLTFVLWLFVRTASEVTWVPFFWATNIFMPLYFLVHYRRWRRDEMEKAARRAAQQTVGVL